MDLSKLNLKTLSGTLSHFAAGVVVIVFKPYKVVDLVDIQGVVGHVKELQVFNAVINSLDNKKVIIPNGIAIRWGHDYSYC